MLSGKTPRLPSVAESSVKDRPSMDRFWSNGATEKACMICASKKIKNKTNTANPSRTDTKHTRVNSTYLDLEFLQGLVGGDNEGFLPTQLPVTHAPPNPRFPHSSSGRGRARRRGRNGDGRTRLTQLLPLCSVLRLQSGKTRRTHFKHTMIGFYNLFCLLTLHLHLTNRFLSCHFFVEFFSKSWRTQP